MNDVDYALSTAKETNVFEVEGADLEELPDELELVPDLREIHVRGNRITALPEWLVDLRELEVLDLATNPLEVVPRIVGELSSLRHLGLASCLLHDLDPVLAGLSDLEALVLSGNSLTALPPWVNALRELRFLDLGHNPINRMPSELDLPRLTHLYLWGHGFETVPRALASLHALEVLDVSLGGSTELRVLEESFPHRGREVPDATPLLRLVGSASREAGPLREMPAWAATSFPSLRLLYAGGNRLRELPDRLPARLLGLYLGGNELDELPRAVLELEELVELDLCDNNLESLPNDIQRFVDRLEVLDLVGNPLGIPPEVLESADAAAIIEYTSLVYGKQRKLDQAKLLVVGEGSVGKTSLVKRLVGEDFSENEDKTEGIDVKQWALDVADDRIVVNIWDFGGQEIMHATHQFFLTKRSVYILVVDARQDEEQNRIEYWLKLIDSFSDSSPVIVVGNKIDQKGFDVDSRGLRAKYPNIVEIVPVSCLQGIGVDDVRTAIAEAAGRLRHVRDLLPAEFFAVKEELEGMKEDFLTYDEFEQICRRHGVAKASQEVLVGFLHDLGTVLCFRADPRLADTNILNPSWVTTGVYRILNSNRAAQRKGLLSEADVNAILDSPAYPADKRFFILDMMMKFELCFSSDGTYLVPDLLTKEEPDTGDWSEALRFEVLYDVLPSSVISRLIVRMRALISKTTVWRTGFVVAMDENRALIKADREDARIRVWVDGPVAGRRGLLTAIRIELRSIEETIPGLVGEERVPVAGHPDVWVPYRHLIDLEAAGRDKVVPQGLTEEFGIRGLLAGVESLTDSYVLRGRSVGRGPSWEGIGEVADRSAWTVKQATLLVSLLAAALIVIVRLLVVPADTVNAQTAAIGTTAIGVLVVLAVVALRATNRVSELSFLSMVKLLRPGSLPPRSADPE